VVLGLIGQVGVAGGSEDRVMAEDLLYLDQVNAGFDQVSGIAVPKTVRGDLFFRPQAVMTLCRVFCTPPGSSGVVTAAAPWRPDERLGNISTGLPCTGQNRRRS
jgi:hypothetical protein